MRRASLDSTRAVRQDTRRGATGPEPDEAAEERRSAMARTLLDKVWEAHPGMTSAGGDRHTPTHGAAGAIAVGIGTTQVRDVLATQCLAMAKPELGEVRVEGAVARGVDAKGVVLWIINQLGGKGGVGY